MATTAITLSVLAVTLAVFIALRMVWRNVDQALRGLTDPQIPPRLELAYQILRWLAIMTVWIYSFVWAVRQRDFVTLFVTGVIWLCLLLVELQKRAEKKDKLKLAPEVSGRR